METEERERESLLIIDYLISFKTPRQVLQSTSN